MVYSPTGRSDFFVVHGFTTVYSSGLRKTDTIVFAKLNKPTPALPRPLPPPRSNRFEINKAPGGLIEDLQYSPSFRILTNKIKGFTGYCSDRHVNSTDTTKGFN